MQLFLLWVWFAVCADRDARYRQVPNALTLGALGVFVVYLLTNGHTWLNATAADGLFAGLLALVFTLPGYALGRLGAGDVKFLLALAVASDSVHLLATFIGAGAASLLWLLIRRTVWPRLHQGLTQRYVQLAPGASNNQPFVPFLLVGFSIFEIWIR